MGKKLLVVLFCGLFFLTACSKSYDATKYVSASANGLNGAGKLSTEYDYEKLILEVFNKPVSELALDIKNYEKTFAKIESIYSGITLVPDKDRDLSNGDVVNIEVVVDKSKLKDIKGGTFKYTVEGLKDPEVLTSDLVEKHLVVNFTGYNGRGQISSADSTLPEAIRYINFEFEKDGELKNGDEISLVVNDDLKDQLSYNEYVLEENFAPKFEVTGLSVLAENTSEIKNYSDVVTMVDELVNRTYQDSWSYYSIDTANTKTFYRQFDDFSENSYNKKHGLLIKVVPVTEYDDKEKTKQNRTFTGIIGYSDLVLDDSGNVNVAKLEEYITNYDSTYSLNSVHKLLEGMGFVEVK